MESKLLGMSQDMGATAPKQKEASAFALAHELGECLRSFNGRVEAIEPQARWDEAGEPQGKEPWMKLPVASEKSETCC